MEHKINLKVSDIYGNTSTLKFKVKSTNNPFLKKCILSQDTTNITFQATQPNIFKQNDITLHMQALSLYEPINFQYKTSDSIPGVFGKVHHIHYQNIPIHKEYVLALKANIPETLKNKTYIATTDLKGNFWHIGGVWIKDHLKTKTKTFGNFCIIADTIQPEIKAINIYNGKN